MERITITRQCDMPDCNEYQAVQTEYLVNTIGKGKPSTPVTVDLCPAHLEEIQEPYLRLKRNIGVRASRVKTRAKKHEEES